MKRRRQPPVVLICASVAILVLGGLTRVDAATLVINNNDGPGEGFNDPTPVTPVGGNPGTTLGQQRLNVFQRAADIWGSALDSAVPIIVRSAFDPLTCNATSAVLGSAGTVQTLRDFPNAPQSGTWYHAALANALAGFDLLVGTDDISATFNSSIDNNNNCLSGVNWYLGFDQNPGGGISLLVVLLHEFAHGLGFSGFVDLSNGQLLANFPDVFSLATFDNSQGLHWDEMNNPQRRASATGTGNLVWDGARVRDAANNLLVSGQDGPGNVRLYAPSPLELGSSVYHFDTVVSPNVLMEPTVTNSLDGSLDLTDELMADIGWTLPDADGDGLTDYQEIYEFSTNPNVVDSDGDGLTDGQSVVPVASYPAGIDSDSDGFVDGEIAFGTNPNNSDTDGDGTNDGAEVSAGTNPNDAAPVVLITSPMSGSSFSIGQSISLAGTAIDDEDGDLSSTIAWSSDMDGALGAGASISVTLSQGPHNVTASATDSQSAQVNAVISVTVSGLPGDINDDGVVSIADLLLLQRHLIGEITLTATEITRADLHPAGGNGVLDISDLLVNEQLLAAP